MAKRVEVQLALLLLAVAPHCGRIPPAASPSPTRLVAPLRRETLIQGAFVAYTLFWQAGVPGGDPIVFRADSVVENARAGLAGRWTVVNDSTLRIEQTDPITRQVHDLEFRLRVGEGDLASPPPVAGESNSPRYWIRRRGPVTSPPVPPGAPDTAAAGSLLAQDTPVGTLRQITHAQNFDPSFSPDGRRMVYISVVAGREQLFVGSTDGQDVRQLTADSVDHEDPAWSPDGAQIAFVYLTKTTEQIALLPAGGGSTRVLTPSTERTIHPNWAPDSRHLAYCTDDDLAPPKKNASAIKVIDLGDQQVRELITGGVNTYPAWSPDGRHLAFRRMLGETNSEVFLADSDGTHVRNLTNHPAFDGWPAWSPDGHYLAFASNRDGDYQIYVMRADGTGVRLVARSTGRGTAPKWTPDGRAIYFSICRREDTGVGCEIYSATPPTLPRSEDQ